jgi:hypothetical protein
MALVKKIKRDGSSEQELADSVVSTKLWKTDQEQFDRLCKSYGRKPAEMLRVLVNEALTRKELLSREDAGGDHGFSARDLQDEIFNQLKPVRQGLEGLTNYLKEIAQMINELQNTRASSPPEAGVGQTAFNDLLAQIEKHLGDILEKAEINQLSTARLAEAVKQKHESLEGLSQANYVLTGHTHTWVWTILDLLTRYIVMPQAVVMEPDGDVAKARGKVEEEIEKAKGAARRMRQRMEGKLHLPLDSKVKFLSEPREKRQSAPERPVP